MILATPSKVAHFRPPKTLIPSPHLGLLLGRVLPLVIQHPHSFIAVFPGTCSTNGDVAQDPGRIGYSMKGMGEKGQAAKLTFQKANTRAPVTSDLLIKL